MIIFELRIMIHTSSELQVCPSRKHRFDSKDQGAGGGGHSTNSMFKEFLGEP